MGPVLALFFIVGAPRLADIVGLLGPEGLLGPVNYLDALL